MDVSIVIPTWNGRHLLEAYLPSVLEAADAYRRSPGHAAEIRIVIDGGEDDTEAWLRAHHAGQVAVSRHDSNRGFARACATGVEEARHPTVLLLNNDVRLGQDAVAPLASHFQDPEVFAVTGKIFRQDGTTFCNGGKRARFRRGMWSSYENYDLLPGVRPDLELLSFSAVGAFCAFDRDKFMALGGFDALVFLVEDVELSYRAWKRGWTVKYEPRAVAYHDASQTIGRHFSRRSVDALARRNRILMHWMLLHDRRMFGSHILSLTGRFLVAWLALDWRFYWGLASGLTHLAHIRAKRREARRTMVRSDRELLRLLENFYRTAPIALRRE